MATLEKIPQIMMSYQWDSQRYILRIKTALEDQNYKVWMDIEQMSGNIYKKMSEAVETSDLIIVCMSSKYQASENCNRELQYAQDLRKKIIPIKIEEEYRPQGPLGLIVSGALYVDFSDPSKFDEKVEELTSEIMLVLGDYNENEQRCIPDRGPRYTSHIPSQVNQFTGRDKDIEQILQDLQSNQLVLITGSPGIGKTGLAIEVAHRLKRKSSSSIINFIDLQSIPSVEVIVSKILLCFLTKAENQPAEILHNVLNSIKGEVVLIFDNAEDALTDCLKDKFLRLVKELLTKSTNLKLLCTSRLKFHLLGINCKEEILQALETGSSMSIMLTIVPNLSKEDSTKLIAVCGSAPLPVWIVSNLIKDGGYAPEDIIKEIKSNAARPIKSYNLEYLPENCQLEACINSSYTRLSSDLQKAFCCLSIFPSTFDIDAAKSILTVADVERTLTALKVRSLLCYDEVSNLYYMHPYIRTFSKSCKGYDLNTTKLKFEKHFLEMLLTLASSYFSKDFMAAVQSIQRENYNITEMLTLITEDRVLYETYKQLADVKVTRFMYFFIPKECYISFYTELLDIATQKNDKRTQSLANFCLAYQLKDNTKDEEAISRLTVALSQYGKRGPDKFFVPICHSYIAWCQGLQGNESEAKKHVNKTKKFLHEKKNRGPNLSFTILLNVTANALDVNGCCEESVEVGLEALQISEDLLGEHTHTALHLHNLGARYLDLAKSRAGKDRQHFYLEEALKYSVRAGRIYQSVFGNNEETADSMYLSGLISFKLQKFKKSSEFFKRSTEIQEILYGSDNEKVIKARYTQEMADNKVAAERMRLKMTTQT